MVAVVKPGSRRLDGPLHFSKLKSVARSLMHYRYDAEHERAETESLRLGKAVDALLFGTCGVIGYDGQRRGKEWAAFAEANAGSICLNKTELDRVRGMSAALEARDDAMELLTGTRQKSIEWKIAGRRCAGTPDVFTPHRITELKTCASAHPSKFVWDGIKFGYHSQLAWYMEGLALSGHARPELAYIVAVESKAPHPVTVFVLTDRAIDLGSRTWRAWFERLRVAEDCDAWPPYAEGTVPFDVPEDDGGFSLRIGGEDVEID